MCPTLTVKMDHRKTILQNNNPGPKYRATGSRISTSTYQKALNLYLISLLDLLTLLVALKA